MNRLAQEKSPYLLQHADNPVDWYPWGKEAFQKARQEDKPIFLSIGYSTCHWCHVMEHESFEDDSVAELLKKHFVAIKVDREERPDVDSLYMQAVIQMAGQGGWPLLVFLTPELKPFYGGTYFPPEDRFGTPGFKSVLRGVAQAWEQKRSDVLQSSIAMEEALKAQEAAGADQPQELTAKTLDQAYFSLSSSFDPEHGGFAPAPKFPRAHALSFLLRYWKRSNSPQALAMVETTLQKMAAGGIWDHVGKGFHRYSTDARWFLPHFEKMLYDQAILARAYLEAYQTTGNETYAKTAHGIFEYVLRDMTSPEGAFYSAEDADSLVKAGEKEKKEGAFYVWSAAELKENLGAEAEVFMRHYGAREEGNVEQDPMGEFPGKNHLYQALPENQALAEKSLKKLFEARNQRSRPHLDDKILTDWNGLMIGALAFGGAVLREPRYAQAAQRAADFILTRLVRPSTGSGRTVQLLHRYRDNDAGITGTLEDHAFLISGLLDLYEATLEARYLSKAKELTQQMVELFWDPKRGGFYLTGTHAEKLLVRQKEVYDGAIPSGNSIAALDLLRLGKLSMDKELEQKAADLMKCFSGQVAHMPSAYPQLLIALDFALGPSMEIVLAGNSKDPLFKQMQEEVYRRFLPNKVLAKHADVPFGQQPIGGRATAYVCRNYACNLPTSDLKKLQELLN